MPRDKFDHLAITRGYHDVNPESCWSDWHRLRVQLTGRGCLPRIVLCVLADTNLEARCASILDDELLECQWEDQDARMPAAFRASEVRYDPSLTEQDLAAIQGHQRVLYILSKNLTSAEAPDTAALFLKRIGQLFDAGALAIKSESSGSTHGHHRWVELASLVESDRRDWALIRAFVQMPIHDGADLYTCGLQLLGLPDLIMGASLSQKAFGPGDESGWEAVELFFGFAHYLLAECPPGAFASESTFAATPDSPRFVLTWEPCKGYDEDDFFFNPFGRWRFSDLSPQ